jgi:hypothetical protein
MEALSRLAEAGLEAATREAALREAEAAVEAAVASAWTITPHISTATGRCACGHEVRDSLTSETVRWEDRPLAALGEAVTQSLSPWITSLASLHQARFALLDAAKSAPDAPLQLLLEPFFSSLQAAMRAQPPVPAAALQALQHAILLLALRPSSPEAGAPPAVLAHDVSLYLLDRLITVRGVAWGRVLLQPPATSARTILAFAARVLDEQAPASSENEALIALTQCNWTAAAKATEGEENAILASLASLLTRATTLGWGRVYGISPISFHR